MVARDVERLEVVEVRLDLRPLGHREPEAHEDGHDLVAHARQRMEPAPRRSTARQREVRARALALAAPLALEHLAQADDEEGFERTLRLVGGGANQRALLGRQGAERLQDLGQGAGAPEILDPDGLQLARGGGTSDGGPRLARHRLDARMGHDRLSAPGLWPSRRAWRS